MSFIILGNNDDVKVGRFNRELQEIKEYYNSIWEWIADFYSFKKMHIDIQNAQSESDKEKVRNEYKKAGFID